MVTVGGQFVPFTQIAEMIKQQWKKIGIDVDVKELERNLAFTRDSNNENQIIIWANDGTELLYLFPRHALPGRRRRERTWAWPTPSGTRRRAQSGQEAGRSRDAEGRSTSSAARSA